jgi:hypothetical protein
MSDRKTIKFFERKKRTSRKKIRKFNKTVKRTRRTSRSRSFGMMGMTPETQQHFKRFLVTAIIIGLRAMIKQDPNSVPRDLRNLEYGALNFLTINSLIDILSYMFGTQFRDRIVLFGILFFTLGIDMSKLI